MTAQQEASVAERAHDASVRDATIEECAAKADAFYLNRLPDEDSKPRRGDRIADGIARVIAADIRSLRGSKPASHAAEVADAAVRRCIEDLKGYQSTLRKSRYDDLFGSGYNQAINDAIERLAALLISEPSNG